jgi:hypothetical protein
MDRGEPVTLASSTVSVRFRGCPPRQMQRGLHETCPRTRCCRLPSLRGHGSTVEREVASLEIRVRLPVAARLEKNAGVLLHADRPNAAEDYTGKDRKVDRVKSRNGRASVRGPRTLVGPSLRSSEEGGLHKPDRDGSTPSAATGRSRQRSIPESSSGRTRGFDPLNEGSNPSSGALSRPALSRRRSPTGRRQHA